MSTSYSDRLNANSDKVIGYMDRHGESLQSLSGITGTVSRLLSATFKSPSSHEQDANRSWSLSAILTKVMDVVSPNKGKGLLSFWSKDKAPQPDPFTLPGLNTIAPVGQSTGDLLKTLNITSNDIGTAQIINDLHITSNSMDNVLAGEILRDLKISSNPMVQVMAKELGAATGVTPAPEDEANRRVQKTSMQSGMNSPLNL
ncbi:MAG: hypothetical protein RSD49_21665 [Hafnia sp.]